jgi:hypothetical protein
MAVQQRRPTGCRFMESPDAKKGAHWDDEPQGLRFMESCRGTQLNLSEANFIGG